MDRKSKKKRRDLEATLFTLGKTGNETATEMLISALDSGYVPVRRGALRALLSRRNSPGHKEVLKRFEHSDEDFRQILRENPGRMTHAIRDAILGSDEKTCRQGCQAALWLREYELTPALINACEDDSNPLGDLAAKTLVELSELLYQQGTGPRDYEDRRDPDRIRGSLIIGLAQSASRFSTHKRVEIVKAFLILARCNNSTLLSIINSPKHGSYLPIIELLANSTEDGIVDLLLGWLQENKPPSAALRVISRRSDKVFLKTLLKMIGPGPAERILNNLKRIESFPWMTTDFRRFDILGEEEQAIAVEMAVKSGMKRLELSTVLSYLVAHGNAGGRAAAISALAEFPGKKINDLILAAIDDPDVRVQAGAVRQLRSRGIPGGMSMLIQLIESPHEIIRQAVRESLAEFRFSRYLASYELLDEDVRYGTGMLVVKLDPETSDLLAAELEVESRTRRIRALEIAETLRITNLVEELVLIQLQDSDRVVRCAAVKALAYCGTEATLVALHDALNDRSMAVQEAAEEAIQMFSETEAATPETPPADIDESVTAMEATSAETTSRSENQSTSVNDAPLAAPLDELPPIDLTTEQTQ